MIPLNQKLSVNYFSRIVSTLFLKFEYKRTRNEINQERHIIIERLVTDNLLDLVNLNINNKYLDKGKLKQIKHMYDKGKIFNLVEEEIIENQNELESDKNSELDDSSPLI